MNFEKLHNLIKNPAKLHEITYQELSDLVKAYPYSQNLWHLLLYKNKLEGRKDYEKILNKTATYSVDRDFLFKKLKEKEFLKEEEIIVEEQILELKELSEFEQELLRTRDEKIEERKTKAREALIEFEKEEEAEKYKKDLENSPKIEPVESTNGENVPDVSLLEKLLSPVGKEIEEKEDIAYENNEKDDYQKSLNENEFVNFLSSITSGLSKDESGIGFEMYNDIVSFGEVIENLELDAKTMKSKEKELQPQVEKEKPVKKKRKRKSFQRWIQEKEPDEYDTDINTLLKKKEKEDSKKTAKAKQLAKASVTENNEIVSETLAIILEKQGHFEEAVEMFKKLELLFPEKSGYFAAKIKNASKNIK